MKIQNWHIGTDKNIIRDEEGCRIATLEPTDSPERDEAHARVIAAAPELKWDVENMVAWLTDMAKVALNTKSGRTSIDFARLQELADKYQSTLDRCTSSLS
jgi:hypothetical protein